MNTCQAIIGFLVPRRSCERSVDTQCVKCKSPICHIHSHIETAGTLCPSCHQAPSLQKFDLSKDIYFDEKDLLQFAEQHRKQAKAQGTWIDFT